MLSGRVELELGFDVAYKYCSGNGKWVYMNEMDALLS